MPRNFLVVILALLCLTPTYCATPILSPKPPSVFPVSAHDDATIEWWYVNAHVTTAAHRHLAIVASFFKFGNGTSPFDNISPMPRSHYLIYAVTDLDQKVQRSYSLADAEMVNSLKVLAPFMAAANPTDNSAKALVTALANNKLPKPHQQFNGTASVVNSPFHITYGLSSLDAVNDTNTSFLVNLDSGGKDKIRLTLTSAKPPMAVGGKGETGLRSPTDMYYFSLTRCAVTGQVDTGNGGDQVTDGQGWVDHQWGSSWVSQNNGWDWWGVQLSDGTDILFWRQRDLATGKIFFPMATIMDKDGHQTVTKNILFVPDPKSLWHSSRTGVNYPLAWSITLPDLNLTMRITANAKDQEIPIVGPGGSLWEGSCSVTARKHAASTKPFTPPIAAQSPPLSYPSFEPKLSQGVAYMELVGYNSPAVKAQLTPQAKSRK